MRPLVEVLPINLISGKQYLIEYFGSTPVSCPKFKGTFIENKLPKAWYECTLSKFNQIVDSRGNHPERIHNLQNCFYRYYEADAVPRYYANKVLQHITGDPDFIAA
jgi:hypothetical protein